MVDQSAARQAAAIKQAFAELGDDADTHALIQRAQSIFANGLPGSDLEPTFVCAECHRISARGAWARPPGMTTCDWCAELREQRADVERLRVAGSALAEATARAMACTCGQPTCEAVEDVHVAIYGWSKLASGGRP